MANDRSRVSRRRVLGGSASIGLLAALAGCIDDESVDDLLDEGDDGESDDRDADDEDGDAAGDEPDDPPETVADGFDIDAALAATTDALYDFPVAIGAVASFLAPDDADAPGSNELQVGVGVRGDPDEAVGRLRTRSGEPGALDGVDPEGDIDADFEGLIEEQDEFVRDDDYFRRFEFDDEPDYDVRSGSYSDVLRLVDDVLGYYHEFGTDVVFDEPRWDADEGRYVVEGERLDADDPGTDELTLASCTVHVDADGVVVGIDAELETDDGGRYSLDSDGEYDRPVAVPEPDWLDEAEAAADEEDETADEEPDRRDATGNEVVSVAVGAGDGLAFSPAHLLIDAGTTVVWEWTGEGGAHTVTAVDGEFDSGDPVDGAGHVFEHRFDEPGVYEYVCRPHQAAGMEGLIEVVDG